MRQVAYYYAAAISRPADVPVQSDIQKRQAGGAIAAVGIPAQGVPACNGCHGQEGHGAAPIYPALSGQFVTYTRHQLLLWKQGRRDGDPMNIMELIAKAMTDEQIEAVSAYYAAVSPAFGAPNGPPDQTGTQSPAAALGQSGVEPLRATNILGLSQPVTSNPPPPGAIPSKPTGQPITGTEHEKSP
jgi:cytochrome c553